MEKSADQKWYFLITPDHPPEFFSKSEVLDERETAWVAMGGKLFGPFRSFSAARVNAIQLIQREVNIAREILGNLRRAKKPN